MVRGRVGGDGAPFNLGEATVSRAAVRLSSGEIGFGYTLGRDREKARLIALCDAMVQSAELAGAIETQVVAPLRAAMIERRNRKAEEAAATRVDFYTLVRGEG
jgi:alpha-D-ribose 1-methylphosphonate 5-triphosphate synthase subunit PhnG